MVGGVRITFAGVLSRCLAGFVPCACHHSVPIYAHTLCILIRFQSKRFLIFSYIGSDKCAARASVAKFCYDEKTEKEDCCHWHEKKLPVRNPTFVIGCPCVIILWFSVDNAFFFSSFCFDLPFFRPRPDVLTPPPLSHYKRKSKGRSWNFPGFFVQYQCFFSSCVANSVEMSSY